MLREARELFVKRTRRSLQENLEKYGLAETGDRETPRVYIVSTEYVYDHVIHLEEQRWEGRNKTTFQRERRRWKDDCKIYR